MLPLPPPFSVWFFDSTPSPPHIKDGSGVLVRASRNQPFSLGVGVGGPVLKVLDNVLSDGESLGCPWLWSHLSPGRLSQIREASVTGSQRPAAAGLVFVSKMVELEHERYSCSAMED